MTYGRTASTTTSRHGAAAREPAASPGWRPRTPPAPVAHRRDRPAQRGRRGTRCRAHLRTRAAADAGPVDPSPGEGRATDHPILEPGASSPGASTRPRILATSSRCSRRRSAQAPSSVWRRGREPGTRRRDITSPLFRRRTARGSSSPSSRCGPGTPTTWTGSPTTSPSSGARRASTRLPR